MEILLIVVLAFAVFALWRSSSTEISELRSEIESLRRDVSFLRDRLADALKSAAIAAAAAPAAAKPAQTLPKPLPEPASAEQRTPPPTAPLIQPAPIAVPSLPPSPVVSQPLRPTSAVPPLPTSTFPPHPAPPKPNAPRPAPEVPAALPAAVKLPHPADDPAPAISLEQRLGANWLNKLGIAILVIGLAFFLAVKLQTWGPVGKVLCGFGVGLALLAGGVWLERKPTYRIFARGGIGGGWALVFFTTYAMHHLAAARVLSSLLVDLVLMLVVAAGMVAHSLRYRSQTVTGLAFLLGFVTLLTSHLQSGDGTAAFSLAASAVLAIALVIVTTQRHWAWLELTGLIAVYLSHLVWLLQVLPDDHAAFPEFWPSTALILLYWLIFRLAYVFRTPLGQREENISSLSAVFNSIGVLGLLKFQSAHPEWAFWALIALGVLEMAFAFRVRAKRRQAFVVLSTIATVLLISAVPFRFHGVSWPILWLIQAQVLAIAGLRLGEPVFRRLGLLAGLVTGAVLAVHDVLPLLMLRLNAPDPGSHSSLIVAMALAASLYWIHGEFYPRRWPAIAEDSLEAFVLRITSWLGLAGAVTALWIALPILWLPIGCLALFLLLALAAHLLCAPSFALQSDATAAASSAVLIFNHVLPLALFRLDYPDPSRHTVLCIILSLAAVAFWLRSEAFSRVFTARTAPTATNFDLAAWQSITFPVLSVLGGLSAAAALWTILPTPWIIVGWLALALLLGIAADFLHAQPLAIQADLLSLFSVAGIFLWNLSTQGWWDHKAPLIAAVALLYSGMRRRTVLQGLPAYPGPVYSWAATLLLAFVATTLTLDETLGIVWVMIGLCLFEIGRFSRKGYLRWQGYFLTGIAFLRFLIGEVSMPGRAVLVVLAKYGSPGNAAIFSPLYSLLFEVLVLSAAGYVLMERTRNRERCTPREHWMGLIADGLGTLSIAAWFAYRFPSAWVPVPGGEAWVTVIWAALASTLLALAWAMRRRAFVVQAIALAIAALLRGLALDLFADGGHGFWHGPLFRLALTALLLLAALPFAFLLRGPTRLPASFLTLPGELQVLLDHPEQWFFFTAFAMQVIALAARLSFAHITIAWSLLGLASFLFALAVGERSFRLAGLGLLLVSVAKIFLMDVWRLAPADRYSTLIVLGIALLAVSFLYTRFASVIRRLL